MAYARRQPGFVATDEPAVQVDAASGEGGVSAAQPNVVPGGDAGSGDCRADFRATLKRGEGRAEGEESAGRQEVRPAAVFAGWFRAELTCQSAIVASAAIPPRPHIERILLGGVAEAPEARICFGEGTLAGTELRLAVGARGEITAELLTASAGSRQRLSLVMDEIRTRLRGRGIALTVVDARAREQWDR